MIEEWKEQLTDFEKEVIQYVFNHWTKYSEWPKSLEVYVHFHEKGDIYSIQDRLGYQFFSAGERKSRGFVTKLSIYSIALCEDCKNEINNFMKLLQTAIDIFNKNPETAEISNVNLASIMEISNDELRRVGEIAYDSTHLFNSFSKGENEVFTLGISADIIEYKGVETLEEFIKLSKIEMARKKVIDTIKEDTSDVKTKKGVIASCTECGYSVGIFNDENYLRLHIAAIKKCPNCDALFSIYPNKIWNINIINYEIEDEYVDFWGSINPKIRDLCLDKFSNGFYADAVETAIKEINSIVKRKYKDVEGIEDDGKSLMFASMKMPNPVIQLSPLENESDKNIQEGYSHIFAGAIVGIRNPKAHSNIILEPNRALHLIFLMGLLMNMIDESDQYKN